MMNFISKPKITFAVAWIAILIQINSQVSGYSESEDDNEVDPSDTFIPSALRNILTTEAANYKVPDEMRKNFVYYLSGFDDENRPIWTFEIGKWDVRGKIEGGEQAYKDFDGFVLQAIYRMLNSTQMMATEDQPVDQVIILADLENFSVRQVNSIPTMTYLVQRVKTFIPAFDKLNAAYMINMNYVAKTLLNSLRPLLGKQFDKFEVYGNQKTKWIPQILKRIPRDQIPEWYGGVKDFTPYEVYG